MVRPRQKVMQIRIYVEGGGDSRADRAPMREGFGAFFQEIKEKVSLTVVMCGGNKQTVDDFSTALTSHSDAFNILLIDSDSAVESGISPRRHIVAHHSDWDLPNAADDQFHLMVQVMEAWFLADRQALREYYGKGFRETALPANPDVEQVSKEDICRGLEAAAKDTSKETYQKRRHGAGILKLLDRDRVCDGGHTPHCQRLFDVLEAHI
jgi:hypothetical protein